MPILYQTENCVYFNL